MNDDDELNDVDAEFAEVTHFGPRGVTLTKLPVGAMSGDDTDDTDDDERHEMDDDPPAPAERVAPAPPVAPPAPAARVKPGDLPLRGFVGTPVGGSTDRSTAYGGELTLSVSVGVVGYPNDVTKLGKLLADARERGAAEARSAVSAAAGRVPTSSPELDRLKARVAEYSQKASSAAAVEREAKTAARRLLADGADPTAEEDAADAAAVALDKANRRLALSRADLSDAEAKFAATRPASLSSVKRDTTAAVRRVLKERAELLANRLSKLVMGRLEELAFARAALEYCDVNPG